MKKNGFITSALLYGILALFLVLMLSTIGILANRKLSMDKLKEAALEDVDFSLALNGLEITFDEGEETDAGKTVTINYPDVCEDSRVYCYYKKDEEEPQQVTSKTATVDFQKSGTLVAEVQYLGKTVVSNNLQVIISKSVADQIENGDLDIKDPTTDTGDGLYQDIFNDKDYVYRGLNPNNYIMFNNEHWRIVSINTDTNQIKIIRNSLLEGRRYDTPDGRYDANGYCNNNINGCKIWGSNSSIYDIDGNKLEKLHRVVNVTNNGFINGSNYNLPEKEADLNTYLNNEYYNTLDDTAKKLIEDTWFNVGPVATGSITYHSSLEDNIKQSQAAKWKGKVGLIEAPEYVKASTNKVCDSAYAFNTNSECYTDAQNYLNIKNDYWTMSPTALSVATRVYRVTFSDNTEFLGYATADFVASVRPVVSLSAEIKIQSGEGTYEKPYIIKTSS